MATRSEMLLQTLFELMQKGASFDDFQDTVQRNLINTQVSITHSSGAQFYVSVRLIEQAIEVYNGQAVFSENIFNNSKRSEMRSVYLDLNEDVFEGMREIFRMHYGEQPLDDLGKSAFLNNWFDVNATDKIVYSEFKSKSGGGTLCLSE